jgi:hypothetical protein
LDILDTGEVPADAGRTLNKIDQYESSIMRLIDQARSKFGFCVRVKLTVDLVMQLSSIVTVAAHNEVVICPRRFYKTTIVVVALLG